MANTTISQCLHCHNIIHEQIVKVYDDGTLRDVPIFEGCEECFKKWIGDMKKRNPNFNPSKDIYPRY